jgi:hypothetical protein
VIAAILSYLNYWYFVFFLNEFNNFFEIRVALMELLKPEASLVDSIDLLVVITMLLELFDVFVSPTKVFY